MCFFLTLMGVLLFWNVIAARAQMSKVRPDPVMEKADLGSMNTAIAWAPAGSVVTEDGPVRGTNVFGVLGYLGIPYAAPPVGKLRWMPPQPHGMFTGVFDANTFGNFCTQPNGTGGTLGAEDCLTLNVFTPTKPNAASRNGMDPWRRLGDGRLISLRPLAAGYAGKPDGRNHQLSARLPGILCASRD